MSGYAAAVETSGGTGGAEVQQYMLRFLRSLGCNTVGSIGATAADLANADQRAQVFKQAGRLGHTLVKAFDGKEVFPEQQPERQAFFQRMKNLITFRQEDWPYEYEHWKSQGWL